MNRSSRYFLSLLVLFFHLARLSGQYTLADADMAIVRKDYNQALRICDFLKNLGEQSPAIETRFGIIFSALSEHERALHHLKLAEAGGEKSISSGLLIAECYEALGKIDSASAKYEEIIYADRTNIFPVISFSKMLITNRLYSDAIKWCQLLVDSVPDNYVFRKNLGGCFLQVNMDMQALYHLNEAWEINNNDISLLPAMTTGWLRAKIPENGLPLIKEAISLHPDNPVVHKCSGNLYFATEQYDSAAIAYQKAYDYGDTSLHIVRQLGLCYYAGNNFIEAVPFLLKSYESDTLDFEAVQYLALSLSNSGRQKESINYFMKSINILLPDSALLGSLHAEIGRASADINSYSVAIESYKEAMKFIPDDIDYVFELARLYDATKNYQEAFNHYERYLANQDRLLKEIAESRNLNPDIINLGPRHTYARERIEKMREELFFRGEIKRFNL